MHCFIIYILNTIISKTVGEASCHNDAVGRELSKYGSSCSCSNKLLSNSLDASSGSSLRHSWPRGITEHPLPLSKCLKYRNKTRDGEADQDLK